MVHTLPSGRSRIPQTGAPTAEFGAKSIVWQDFCRKLHENERNWIGMHVPKAPLPRPHWIRQNPLQKLFMDNLGLKFR